MNKRVITLTNIESLTKSGFLDLSRYHVDAIININKTGDDESSLKFSFNRNTKSLVFYLTTYYRYESIDIHYYSNLEEEREEKIKNILE
jgi:hypothetical protein